jgi:predicted DNA repair protein MutK
LNFEMELSRRLDSESKVQQMAQSYKRCDWVDVDGVFDCVVLTTKRKHQQKQCNNNKNNATRPNKKQKQCDSLREGYETLLVESQRLLQLALSEVAHSPASQEKLQVCVCVCVCLYLTIMFFRQTLSVAMKS